MSRYEGVKDMFDGGGPGASGDDFAGGGIVSDIANRAGLEPIGSDGSDNWREGDDSRNNTQKTNEKTPLQMVGGVVNGLRRGAALAGAINPGLAIPGAVVGAILGSGILSAGGGKSGQSRDKIEAIRADQNASPDEKAQRFAGVIKDEDPETWNQIVQEAGGEENVNLTPIFDGTMETALTQAGNPLGEAASMEEIAQSLMNTAATIQTGASPADAVTNPQGLLQSMSGQVPQMNVGAGLIRPQAPMNPSQFNMQPVTGAMPQGVAQVAPQQAQGYNAVQSLSNIQTAGQATAQQGTVSEQALVEAQQAEREETLAALGNPAQLNISNVIDTTTVAGRMLAQSLGEGNYVDSKSTVQGQLEILSREFEGPGGEPTIPSWAAGVARGVSRVAAFKGMTGTAATAAMSQAILEASLPIAQQDATFFQTATMENLNNRQQMAVQKAQVLANFSLADLDARMTAAVENSRAFLQMDMANLNNRQQTEIINTQARVQSILEDARSENAARLFRAESQNDFTKFYDNLNSQISMFNEEQRTSMEKFNVGEINDAQQFNATMENQRDLFYRDMQYNVDLSNARWRQTLQVAGAEMAFEAAKIDVQNMFGLTEEGLNRLWDREDSYLEWAWTTSENETDRRLKIYQIDKDYSAAMAGVDVRQDEVDMKKDQAKGKSWYEVAKIGLDAINGDGKFLGMDTGNFLGGI